MSRLDEARKRRESLIPRKSERARKVKENSEKQLSITDRYRSIDGNIAAAQGAWSKYISGELNIAQLEPLQASHRSVIFQKSDKVWRKSAPMNSQDINYCMDTLNENYRVTIPNQAVLILSILRMTNPQVATGSLNNDTSRLRKVFDVTPFQEEAAKTLYIIALYTLLFNPIDAYLAKKKQLAEIWDSINSLIETENPEDKMTGLITSVSYLDKGTKGLERRHSFIQGQVKKGIVLAPKILNDINQSIARAIIDCTKLKNDLLDIPESDYNNSILAMVKRNLATLEALPKIKAEINRSVAIKQNLGTLATNIEELTFTNFMDTREYISQFTTIGTNIAELRAVLDCFSVENRFPDLNDLSTKNRWKLGMTYDLAVEMKKSLAVIEEEYAKRKSNFLKYKVEQKIKSIIHKYDQMLAKPNLKELLKEVRSLGNYTKKVEEAEYASISQITASYDWQILPTETAQDYMAKFNDAIQRLRRRFTI